jgi:hypothetical protein
MVQTPVGARCKQCARLYKLPTYNVSTRHYVRAVGSGLGAALVIGVIWGALETLLPFFFLNLLLAAGVGYAIGEIISLSVNRKRGAGLAIVAGLAVVVSYIVSQFLPWGFGFVFLGLLAVVFDLLAIAVGVFLAVTRLR